MEMLPLMRSRYVQCVVSVLLAVQLFNFSVDPADRTGRENLGINEIESLLELLVENILQKGDVVPETDEGDEHSGTQEVSFHYLYSTVNMDGLACSPDIQRLRYPSYHAANFDSLAAAIVTPPPQV